MPPSSQSLDFAPSPSSPTVVVPVSCVAGWVTAIAAGGLIVLDVGTAGDPARTPSAITHSSRRVLVRPDYGGTTLRIRLVYSHYDGVQSNPLTIRVFGTKGTGSGSDDFFGVLRNLNGDASVPIITDPSSDTVADNLYADGDYFITQPDNTAHSWDMDGCNRIIIAVERAYNPANGAGTASPSSAYLQARIP